MNQCAVQEGGPGYRQLLAPPGIPRLFAGALVGRVSIGMIPVGVVLFVEQVTASFSTAGLAMAAYAIGSVAGGPLRSWASVRLGHRVALATMSLLSGSALTLLVPVGQWMDLPWSLIALMGVSGCSSPPFGALMRVGWAQKLPERWLSRAFGLDSVVEESTLVLGPLVAAGAVALGGARLAVLAGGAVCLAGGAIMSSAADNRRGTGSGHRSSGGQGIGAAASRVGWMLVVFAGVGFAVGAIEVIVPAVARASGHASSSGGLLAVFALGSACAAFFYGRRTWKSDGSGRLMVLSLGMAAGVVVMMAVDGLLVTGSLLVLVGAAMGPAVLTAYLLADTLVDGAAAKTHAAILAGVACNGGAGAGAAIAGTAVTRFSAGHAFAFSGIVTAVLTAIGFLMLLRDRNPYHESDT
ncbi:MFS transporter [Actinomadura rubrisoli]|uniref:MFS transporter n=1 Tax=Actinomadura rubrisoli TaxID=2530368 RepID=UPI002442F5AE|nr:MFS transporter [Actinomadura rubrisoli]